MGMDFIHRNKFQALKVNPEKKHKVANTNIVNL